MNSQFIISINFILQIDFVTICNKCKPRFTQIGFVR